MAALTAFSGLPRYLVLASLILPLEAAQVACRAPAIRGLLAATCLPQLRLKEGLAHTGLDVSPGQGLVDGQFAVGVEIRAQPGRGERPQPAVELQMFAPGVENAAGTPGIVYHLPQPAVSPRHDGLQQAHLGVVPGKMRA